VNLGNWDVAVIKSLFSVALGVLLFSLFSSSVPTTANEFYGLVVSILMFLGVYFVISIIGWVLIGFPTHWLITKYTKGSYIFYILLPLVFVMLDLLLSGSLLFSLVAFFQALTFRYWVHKKT
jgi:hypothetical protein